MSLTELPAPGGAFPGTGLEGARPAAAEGPVRAARSALRAVGLAGALLAPAPAAQQPLPARGDAGGRAFAELVCERDEAWEGEVLRVRLRVGLARDLVDGELVPLLRRALDLPVHVDAPAFAALPAPSGGRGELVRAGPSFALGDGVARADRERAEVRGDRPFVVLELERLLRAEERGERGEPGQLALAGPVLRFARAARFRESPLGDSVPVDVEEVVVHGAPLALRVRALPSEGRPPEFGGAVGRFRATASAAPRTLAVGESVALELRIERAGPGDADLERFAAPRLPRLADFHVRGVADRVDGDARLITWDLAPLRAGELELPALPFASFATDPPGWVVVRTEPVALDVRPAPATAAAERAQAPPGPPAEADSAGDASGAPLRALLVAGGVLLAAGAALALRRRRPR